MWSVKIIDFVPLPQQVVYRLQGKNQFRFRHSLRTVPLITFERYLQSITCLHPRAIDTAVRFAEVIAHAEFEATGKAGMDGKQVDVVGYVCGEVVVANLECRNKCVGSE